MRTLKTTILKPFFWLILCAILLAACSQNQETSPAVEDTLTPSTATLPPTPETPTATPQPAAAVVNGERISLEFFERELERYLLAQEAINTASVDLAQARQIVIHDLIDQVLLAQGAQEAGFSLSEADVQQRIDGLANDVDLAEWMAEWGYTLQDLESALTLQMTAAHQRDLIAATIPELVEQVELRQVFAFTEAGANRALTSLNSGTPFTDLAFEFSPDTGGYLGWVPRGYLLIPAVEEAAFNQPVGTYSEIIESEIGYHIVLVIEREVRPLSNDARLTLERNALHAWLDARRDESTIEVLVD
jgi:peptidyl-prolyl cis-trans isomerase C